jgi:tetratricopeptide (TPR) repeat protein
MKRNFILALLIVFIAFASVRNAAAQGGGHTLYGDLKVDESQTSDLKPISFDIILYTTGGNLVGRQTINNNGRYLFLNLNNDEYEIVVEVENMEVARIRTLVSATFKNDFRQDISLEWRSTLASKTRERARAVSAADFYKRVPVNQKRFEKAEAAIDKKQYEQAVALLLQLVQEDAGDFQAWTELGTVYLIQKKTDEAEKDYLRAIEINPAFLQAHLNLGRLRLKQKKYDGAIEALTQAVKSRPQSAEANYYLGEAYLQNKRGSLAVNYLNEALRLDPVGMAEAHLRLAALYNAAGMKDKAAAEYAQFLKKKPDYPEKKKLQQYIADNKKS